MQPERILSDEACMITGLCQRTLLSLSARGEIWGARKEGGRWTFNDHILRQWIGEQEKKVIRSAVDAGYLYASIDLGRSQMGPHEYSSAQVYFISCGTHLKIGIASDPVARLRALQVGNPAPLVLLGTLPGGWPLEQHLHRIYAPDRERGEWFRFTPRLRKSVQSILGNDNAR